MKLRILSLITVLLIAAGCGSKDSAPIGPSNPSSPQASPTTPIAPTPVPLPPSFETLSKSKQITFTFTNSAVISRLADTIGGPSYNRAYFQAGALITQGALVTGPDQKYCSMVASAFVTANFPMVVNPAKVKERDFFGNKVLEIYDIGGHLAAECEKAMSKSEKEWMAVPANPITPDDLRQTFGSLVTITIAN